MEEKIRNITFEKLVQFKKLDEVDIQKQLTSIREYPASTLELKMTAYDLPWNYFSDIIFKVTRLQKDNKSTKEFNLSLFDIMNGADPKMYEYIVKRCLLPHNLKKNIETNIISAFYFAKGSITTFRASTAKFIYKHFNATHVLDPTAGWGGRMIGAYGFNIAYTGIDTNADLKPGYELLMKDLNDSNMSMIWDSCLNVDFSKIDYDCVLTSPPYINLEKYQNMELFDSKEIFYKEFLIPLLEKCLKHIKRNGTVCFNISPDMYQELLNFKFRKCDIEFKLPKNTNKVSENPEMIYCWKSVSTPDDCESDIKKFLETMKAKYPDKKLTVKINYSS